MNVVGLTLKDEISRLRKIISESNANDPSSRRERDRAIRELSDIRARLITRLKTV